MIKFIGFPRGCAIGKVTQSVGFAHSVQTDAYRTFHRGELLAMIFCQQSAVGLDSKNQFSVGCLSKGKDSLHNTWIQQWFATCELNTQPTAFGATQFYRPYGSFDGHILRFTAGAGSVAIVTI